MVRLVLEEVLNRLLKTVVGGEQGLCGGDGGVERGYGVDKRG